MKWKGKQTNTYCQTSTDNDCCSILKTFSWLTEKCTSIVMTSVGGDPEITSSTRRKLKLSRGCSQRSLSKIMHAMSLLNSTMGHVEITCSTVSSQQRHRGYLPNTADSSTSRFHISTHRWGAAHQPFPRRPCPPWTTPSHPRPAVVGSAVWLVCICVWLLWKSIKWKSDS